MTCTNALADLDEEVQTAEPWFRSHLCTLVEHPTVSPGGGHEAEIRAGALAACALMNAAGGAAELLESDGTPSVLGRFRHSEPRARVLIYNHLDVQPADGGQWMQKDPFRFEVEAHDERGYLYRGRGTTDDKGPALCALRAASWAVHHKLPIDITLLWETEEEIGSPHFAEIVAGSRDKLASDCVIVSDTIWPTDRQPAISTGLRGSLHARLLLRTGEKDSHSGLVGGVARNPIRELCALATAIEHASFWQEDIASVDADEVASFLRAGFDRDYFMAAHGLHLTTTDVPLEMMLRLWTRPTFELHGLAGGYTGPGTKTIVPHEAELKLSFRLVPDQEPQRIAEKLRRFVEAYNRNVVVEISGGLMPYRATTNGRVHHAISDALEHATGRAPVLVREGGSIGAVPILREQLGVPVHFLPLSLPDHGYHAPNEYFDWRQAGVGITAFARTFAALSSDM